MSASGVPARVDASPKAPPIGCPVFLSPPELGEGGVVGNVVGDPEDEIRLGVAHAVGPAEEAVGLAHAEGGRQVHHRQAGDDRDSLGDPRIQVRRDLPALPPCSTSGSNRTRSSPGTNSAPCTSASAAADAGADAETAQANAAHAHASCLPLFGTVID